MNNKVLKNSTLLSFNLIILTVIRFTGGTGKAKVAAGDGAPRRPNRRSANHTFCAVFLCGKRFPECLYQFFF